MLNVILRNLKYLLNTISERSLGLLKVYWHQNFLLTSQCTVVGQLLIHVQKGSACPPSLVSLGPSDAWQAYRSVYNIPGLIEPLII